MRAAARRCLDVFFVGPWERRRLRTLVCWISGSITVLSASVATFPRIGTAVQVKNCANEDKLLSWNEVDPIWKTLKQRSSRTRFDLGKLKGAFRDPFKQALEPIEELQSKPTSLVLVPKRGFDDVELGVPVDADLS